MVYEENFVYFNEIHSFYRPKNHLLPIILNYNDKKLIETMINP